MVSWGTEEVDQSVKYFPQKHVVLSSITITHKKYGYIPSLQASAIIKEVELERS